jgi:Kef-type K+ transport system membrane component KefB
MTLLASMASEPLVPPELRWIPLLLIAAKLSHVVERWGQASVLGELLVGVLLGNLGLIGIHTLEPISTDVALRFLAEFGVVLLLFQTGLESSLDRMRAVGGSAAAVALTGVVAPMALAALVTPLVLPGLGWITYAFVGAALTATSVGITARVFRDLGIMQRTESQIVLGAAVLDDLLGLLLLAVLTGLLATGSVSAAGILWIVAKALVFLTCGIVLEAAAPGAARPAARSRSPCARARYASSTATCISSQSAWPIERGT